MSLSPFPESRHRFRNCLGISPFRAGNRTSYRQAHQDKEHEMSDGRRRRLCAAGMVLTLAATVAFVGALAMTTTAFARPTSSTHHLATGILNLRGTLRVSSTPVQCPPDQSPDNDCRTRTGEGLVPGLGRVSETYLWSYRMGPPACPSDFLGKPLRTSGRLVVAGKGEIHVALQDGERCIDQEPMRNEPQDFTITGGTGSYKGASGSGRVERSLGGGVGGETWNATLEVPGLEFDVTPPTLTGATSKTVRAPKGAKPVRVTYAVSAHDDVDGAVPVSCSPPSGSRFSRGRTDVTCSATDASANTQTARFTITVKRRP